MKKLFAIASLISLSILQSSCEQIDKYRNKDICWSEHTNQISQTLIRQQVYDTLFNQIKNTKINNGESTDGMSKDNLIKNIPIAFSNQYMIEWNPNSSSAVCGVEVDIQSDFTDGNNFHTTTSTEFHIYQSQTSNLVTYGGIELTSILAKIEQEMALLDRSPSPNPAP